MKIVKIFRVESGEQGTFGVMTIDDKAFCVTLERPWLENAKGKSCIPWRRYICSRYVSKKFGETFIVDNVPERSGILFHSGNRAKDSKGCIILGSKFHRFASSNEASSRGVMNSKDAVRAFMSAMTGVQQFTLLIADVKIYEV